MPQNKKTNAKNIFFMKIFGVLGELKQKKFFGVWPHTMREINQCKETEKNIFNFTKRDPIESIEWTPIFLTAYFLCSEKSLKYIFCAIFNFNHSHLLPLPSVG